MSRAAVPQYYEYPLHDATAASDTASLPPAYEHSDAVHPDDLADDKKQSFEPSSSSSYEQDLERARAVLSGTGPSWTNDGSIHLDCLKTKDFKYGTRIVGKTSLPQGIQEGEVLYTIATHGAWNWKGAVTTFQRGDSKGPSGGSTKRYQSGSIGQGEHPPYAELSITKLRLAESPEYGATLEESSRRKILHSQKWWSAKDRFNLDDVEYRLKAKFSGDYELYLPSGPGGDDGLLLALFTHKSWSSTLRGRIQIFPSAIFSSSSASTVGAAIPKEALIWNGRPTWLLDVAVLAEYVYKAERDSQAAAGASSASASAGASAAIC